MRACGPSGHATCVLLLLITSGTSVLGLRQLSATDTKSEVDARLLLQQQAALEDAGYSNEPYEENVDPAELQAEFAEDESIFYEPRLKAASAPAILPQGPPLPGASVPLASLPAMGTNDKLPSAATQAAAAAIDAIIAQERAPKGAPTPAVPKQDPQTSLTRSVPRETQAVEKSLDSTASTLSTAAGKAANSTASALSSAAGKAATSTASALSSAAGTAANSTAAALSGAAGRAVNGSASVLSSVAGKALNGTAAAALGVGGAASQAVVGASKAVLSAVTGAAPAPAPGQLSQPQQDGTPREKSRSNDTLQSLYPGVGKGVIEGPHKTPGTRHHHNLAGGLPRPGQAEQAVQASDLHTSAQLEDDEYVSSSAATQALQQRQNGSQDVYGTRPGAVFTSETTSQPSTASLTVQQSAIAKGADPLSQGGQGTSQTLDPLDLEEVEELTHNQAAQKASEEHLRSNAGRLSTQDEDRIQKVDETMLLGEASGGPQKVQGLQSASGASKSRMRELAASLGAAMQSANGTSFVNIVMILAAGGAMVGVSVYYMRFMRPSHNPPRIVDVGSMAGPRYSRVPGRQGASNWEEEKGWGDDNWDEPGTGRISKHSKGRDKWDQSF